VDLASLGYGIADIVATYQSGNSPTASQWFGVAGDVVGVAVPFATGIGAAIRAGNKVDGALDAAARLKANKAKAEAFEQAVGAELRATHDVAVPQITVRTEGGGKTRLDWVTKDSSGAIACVECKASATAPLTPAQRGTHPKIAQTGGVVAGKGKAGIPGGTVIPPGPVEIRRPE
jgi:filamentous hemagglutinin